MMNLPNDIFETGRRIIDCKTPKVMGILNSTPDSFYDGGAFALLDDALGRAGQIVNEGAEIIDIGGESTRPGSNRVSVSEEIARVVPIIERICTEFDVAISVDTSKAEVASAAIEAGAEIVNDISGFTFDGDLPLVVSEAGCGVVLMHLRGTFASMHNTKSDTDIIEDVKRGLDKSVEIALAAGIDKHKICLDPGFGFSKTLAQTIELLRNLDEIIEYFRDFSILIGTSRKSFLAKLLENKPVDERLYGTIAVNTVAAIKGVRLFRVHDVQANVDALGVVSHLL
ncbi:MAG: dihydropteroate synthase [Pyrinomonadaceae bacterium]